MCKTTHIYTIIQDFFGVLVHNTEGVPKATFIKKVRNLSICNWSQESHLGAHIFWNIFSGVEQDVLETQQHKLVILGHPCELTL